jgi:hypothetical protein
MDTCRTCSHRQYVFNRRDMLKTLSCGFGYLAFQQMANAVSLRDGGRGPLRPRQPHFEARAKRVIFLCMAGGPSHLDTFDYKPQLIADDGMESGGSGRRTARLLGSPFEFGQHGESGLWISELFPNVATHADRMCLLRSMHTDIPAHAQAFVQMHTGSFQFVRPSMGAWTLYGLGTENENLPGFITINPPTGQGGAQNYGSAFLPAAYQGMPVNGGGADASVPNIRNSKLSVAGQRDQLDLIQALNEERLERDRIHPGVEGVIESYELAFRMQAEVPDVMDLNHENEATRELYGLDNDETAVFGRQCLLARRCVEAGVRFVEVGRGGWDHHRNLRESLRANCTAIDTPISGLLTDLAQRGLLEDTLVVWGGEFGRTPTAQNGDGRDHNNKGFTMWMAGGGVRGGMSYGSTDEHGGEAVDDKVHIHDWHATLLHLMGLDHERLTYPYAGRDFRLTEVYGNVVKGIMV